MKKLMAWNGFYGFESFEVFIAYGETLEEKKKYYEDLGYKCWIEIEREEQGYYTVSFLVNTIYGQYNENTQIEAIV